MGEYDEFWNVFNVGERLFSLAKKTKETGEEKLYVLPIDL